jgi:hypothetical protein
MAWAVVCDLRMISRNKPLLALLSIEEIPHQMPLDVEFTGWWNLKKVLVFFLWKGVT